MTVAWLIVVAVVCAAGGLAGGYMFTRRQNVDHEKEAAIKIEAMLAQAKAEGPPLQRVRILHHFFAFHVAAPGDGRTPVVRPSSSGLGRT